MTVTLIKWSNKQATASYMASHIEISPSLKWVHDLAFNTHDHTYIYKLQI